MDKTQVPLEVAKLEKSLRKEMLLALRAYLDASAGHNRIIQEAQALDWRLDEDGHQAIHSAAMLQHNTLDRYVKLLRALQEVMVARKPASETGPTESRAPNVRVLTPRESEILRLIAEGLSSREIAVRLKISFKTVVSHRYQLMRKLGIHDVVSLVRYAVRNKLTEL